MSKRDYLTGLDLSAEETSALLERGLAQKRAGRSACGAVLAGKSVALLFEKRSTRTRVSFEAGVAQLGGSAIFLSGQQLQIARGETISDSAKVLSRYVDAIVLRTFGHERAEDLAANADVPVINGLTDLHHPCQALADFLTLWERFGSLRGLKVAYLGDGNNVLHSLLLVGSLIGVNVAAACPPAYQPAPDIVKKAGELAAASGSSIQVGTEIEAACRGAHALYTDVWTSMGQEAEEEERRKTFLPYRVHGELFHGAEKEAVFMHCLPAHRGEEVTADVIDGPRSVVFDQAENRLHAQKVLLEKLVGGDHGG